MDLTSTILQKTAREKLGVPHLYDYQERTILDIVNRPHHRLVLFPTGAGKSLIFTLPAFFLEGLTVIVYPLLALMDDQKRRFSQAGLDSVVLRGGQTREQRNQVWEKLSAPRPPILITNPEMLLQPQVFRQLEKLRIGHLVFDEAHCISQWGRTFREAYWNCARRALDLNPERLTALTATADAKIEEDLSVHLFREQDYERIARVPDRPNIHYEVWRGLSRSVLLHQALLESQRPLIVFVSSRMGTVQVARLAARTLDPSRIRLYHAGLEKQEKHRTESWFFESHDGVLVTTCAYGMGVDKSNVRTVVHWDPSESVVAYLQESGRAGRDGQQSRSILLVGPDSRFRSERDKQLAFDDTSCRRASLLKELGPWEVPCKGCDVCAGNRRRDPVSIDFHNIFETQTHRHRHPTSILKQLWGRAQPESTRQKLHLSTLWANMPLDLEDLEDLKNNWQEALDRGILSDYICRV